MALVLLKIVLWVMACGALVVFLLDILNVVLLIASPRMMRDRAKVRLWFAIASAVLFYILSQLP